MHKSGNSLCRYGFRIFAGIVAVLLIIPFLTGLLLVPKDVPHPTDKTIDWIGGALITCANLAVMLALSLGVDYGWKKPCTSTLYMTPRISSTEVSIYLCRVTWQMNIPRRSFLQDTDV